MTSTLHSSLRPRVHLPSTLRSAASAAEQRIIGHLTACRHPDGYWEDPLVCDTTVDADFIIYLHALGRHEPEIVRSLMLRLLDEQLPDGGWNIFPGGAAELNATVKGYVALKLAGVAPDAPHMSAARERIAALGGLVKTNSFTRIYLAILGMIDWDSAPAIPPEMILLPRGAPFHVYAMSYWSRCIVVPLSILWAHRWQVGTVKYRIDELPGGGTVLPPASDNVGTFSLKNLFLRGDRVMKWLSRLPAGLNPLRSRAITAARDWIVERFGDSAGLGAIYPAMVNAAFALRCLGYGPDHPLMKQATAEVDALLVAYGDRKRVVPCTSPVWNTALTTLALGIGGVAGDDPRMTAAGQWLLDREVRRPGDWRSGKNRVEPSGWFFQFSNGFYPDTDDTAMVVMSLAQVELPGIAPAIRRGVDWIMALQGRDGGWGAFDVDNDQQWMTQVPFADHNAMIDPSTADITSRILEMLGRTGLAGRHERAVRRAVAFLRRDQRPDGSWYGRWGVNFLYGTWQVLEGLAQIGEPMDQPMCLRAVRWLEAHQNRDGGWGESPAGYDDPERYVATESMPSQTAWAVMGLLAAGRADTPAVRRGIAHLAETQKADGDWREPLFTGTGFPRVFYLQYPMYRKYFPLLALAKWLRAS